MVARLLKQLLLPDQRNDLVIVDGKDGVIAQNLRVLVEKFLHLVELDVSIGQELFLLILVHVVLMEKGTMISTHELLIDLPADFTRELNDIVIEFALLLV